MTIHVATCLCGQLKMKCEGDPVRVSVCHCLDCQKRSGSAFALQARWPDDRVEISGDYQEYARRGDSGKMCTFRFCPTCGGTIAYVHEDMPDLVAVPAGTFADPALPAPDYSVYEERAHSWVTITGDGIQHYD